MNYIILLITINFSNIGLFYSLKSMDCSYAYIEADDAYNFSKKAYNSDKIEDLKYYAKKAMNSFDDAMVFALDCGCDDAYLEVDDGYNNAKKAYNSNDLDDSKNYMRKARIHADSAMSYADDCNN